jgi:hypothetical protein
VAVHVQCNNCGSWEITDNHANPDAAVRCRTPAGDPPGSPDGSCCTVHASHEEHAEHAASTGDAGCRPVTITIMSGGVAGMAD